MRREPFSRRFPFGHITVPPSNFPFEYIARVDAFTTPVRDAQGFRLNPIPPNENLAS
jgi:hypothetical protein